MIRHLLIATVMLIATVAGSFGSVTQPAAQATDQVDPTSTLLQPTDLSAISLDDYGTGVGVTGGPIAMSAFDRTYRGAGADDRRFPSTDGLEQGAALYLLDRSVTDGSPRVLSSVVVYNDADAATDAFDAVVAARSDAARQTDRDLLEDLDVYASASFIIDGVPPFDDADFRQTSAVAQSGVALIEVAIERQDGTTAAVDDVVELLSVALGRLAAAADGEAAVGSLALEISGSSVLPNLSRYVLRDGTPVAQFGQTDEDADGQTATFTAYGTTDVYQFGYTVGGDTLLGGFLSRHESEGAARDYFRTIPDLLSSNDRYDQVRVGNSIVQAGDSATLVSYGIDGDPGVVVTEVIVLLGDTVAELIVNAPEAISTADMTSFALAAEACVTGDDCQPLIVPDDASFGTI